MIGERSERALLRALRRSGRPSRCLSVLAALAAALLLPLSAQASPLPEIETEHMPEIVEWVYRTSALKKDPLLCAEACNKLWLAEGKGVPATAEGQAVWDELGSLETSRTGLWGPLSRLESAIDSTVAVTTSPIQVGWQISQETGGEGDKWMHLVGPAAQHVPNAPGWCEGPTARLRGRGYTLNPTNHQELELPFESWVMHCYSQEDLIAEFNAETIGTCSAGGDLFGDPAEAGGGWNRVEWWWNDQYCGTGPLGEELSSKTTAVGYTAPFHFSQPQDWIGQKVEGPGTSNVGTNQAEDPGLITVKPATEVALEEFAALRRWVQWVLEGEHGANPLATSPEEEFGPGDPGAPNKPKCLTGDPVNCATGNQVETQTDLAVGGLGGLHLARTYNAQLAAKQTSPGPFGYGWTGSYSAYVELGEAGQAAIVHLDDGATETFRRSGESWVPANPLVQATLASEAGGYRYTLPDQTVLRFDSAGRLSSETDRNGNALTISRSGEGRLESVAGPAGRKLSFAYSGGFVESVKDPLGHTVKYAYEGGNLTSVTLPGEESPRWQFKYDGSHRLTTMTDGRGGTTTNEYDGENRVISQTDPLERTTSFEYGPSETKITNKATGAVTRETFSVDNEPLSVTHGYGTASATTEEFGYDGAGNRTSATDGNKHTTKFGYDGEGNKTSVLDADEHETKWSYDSTHDVERSLATLTAQAADFCSAPCASSHVARTSRGVL